MSKEAQALIVNYVDENGRTAKTKFQFVLTDEFADIQLAWDAILPLLTEITGCGITSAEVTTPTEMTPTTATAGTGTNTAMDKLKWTFSDEDGNLVVFTTPAPLAAEMESDDYHVNDTQADIAAFIAAVQTYLASPYGLALTTFVDCVRTWRNRKAKNA